MSKLCMLFNSAPQMLLIYITCTMYHILKYDTSIHVYTYL